MAFRKIAYFVIFIAFFFSNVYGQAVPAIDENIPYIVTFGKDANKNWGDDDFTQIFFFIVPEDRLDPIFLRVYDPDTGGELDEQKGEFNSKVKFTIYGGNNCWSDTAAQGTEPVGNYKSGVLISSKTFGNDAQYDKNWYTFNPLNPYEGEYAEKLRGRVFKIIIEGMSGDDGNLYRFYLSSSPNKNSDIEGSNFFTYEYTFRLSDDVNQVSQIYPYIDDKTTSVIVSNFDWDNDGEVKIISVAKNGLSSKVSGEGNWVKMDFPIVEEEKNTSLELKFIKNKTTHIKHNNVGLTVQNQYGISLPFYVIPIGGIPIYSPKIKMIEVD